MPQIQSKHPLPADLIADFLLRPQPHNNQTLDPRIPPYITVLTRLGYINATSILKSMFRYSCNQEQLQTLLEQQRASQKADPNSVADNEKRADKTRIWKNSYWAEEVIFYHVLKLVMDGNALRNVKGALELVEVVSQWIKLFTAASNAFAADMMSNAQEIASRRNEMDTARAAFLPLLLRLIDHDLVLKALSAPQVKRVRKRLSDRMAAFVPTLQPPPQFVSRLDMFRTETLAAMDPVDKRKQAEDTAVEELLDSAVGLNTFEVQEIPIPNTRAGLYIYLNACVSALPVSMHRISS